MTTSLWAVFGIIGVICIYVFARTVSNDAKNDYRIRDILTHAKGDEQDFNLQSKQTVPQDREKFEEEEENIYEELARKQAEASAESSFNSAYSTTTHEDSDIDGEKQEKPYEQEVFYEKINDDACPYDKDEYQDDYIDEDDEIEPEEKSTKIKTIRNKSIFDYVKTFWHGITFTVGMLICIYSFIGVTTQVQTSNDAIVYSIWLLIGVILIK